MPQANGKAKPSFLAFNLETLRNHNSSETSNTVIDIQGAAGAVYAGAAETVCRLSFDFGNGMLISLGLGLHCLYSFWQ